MTNNEKIEEQIAKFIEENGTIVIQFSAEKSVGIIRYVKYINDFIISPAETRYNLETGKTYSSPSDMALKPYQLNSTRNVITELIPQLLLETKGDVLFNDRWKGIHNACENLEKNIYESP